MHRKNQGFYLIIELVLIAPGGVKGYLNPLQFHPYADLTPIH